MNAGSSSADRAAASRAEAVPRGLKRRLLAAVGMDRQGARAAALAIRCDAGAEGERRTAALLKPLGREDWHGLYDRRIPGLGRANADHVLVAPSGRVFMVDSKLWSAKFRVHVVRGRLMHGEDRDYDRQIDGVLLEARKVDEAVGAAVTPIIAVHNAPVDGGGFVVRGVPVVPADRLVELLRRNAGQPDPRAARAVALRAHAMLRRYVE